MYIDLEEIQENDFIRENQNTAIDDDYDDGDVVDNKNEDDGGAMSKTPSHSAQQFQCDLLTFIDENNDDKFVKEDNVDDYNYVVEKKPQKLIELLSRTVLLRVLVMMVSQYSRKT